MKRFKLHGLDVSTWPQTLDRSTVADLLRTSASVLAGDRDIILRLAETTDDVLFVQQLFEPLLKVLRERADDLEAVRPLAGKGEWN